MRLGEKRRFGCGKVSHRFGLPGSGGLHQLENLGRGTVPDGWTFVSFFRDLESLLLRRMILECQRHPNFSRNKARLDGKFLNIARKTVRPEVGKDEHRMESDFYFLS